MKLLNGEWLFVSTRKCATNSMYEALPGKRIEGFHGIPDTRLAPIHWTIVRNPYDRALSIWGSTCNRPGDKYGAKFRLGDDLSFKNFAKRILAVKSFHKPIFANMSFHHDLFMLDDYVQIENLNEGVKRITGLDINIPHLNTSKHEYVMDEEDIYNVNLWAGEDFNRYNYEQR
jgi:hypothetical protein